MRVRTINALHSSRSLPGRAAVPGHCIWIVGAVDQTIVARRDSRSVSSNVPFTIQHADGTAAITVNQKQTPPIDALFLSLGEFSFKADQPAIITITNDGTNGIVGADAVQVLAK